MHRYGSVLLGGTKIECAIGADDHIEASVSFPTDAPEEAFGHIAEFFQTNGADVRGVGVGSFGPVDIPAGVIAKTPKPGWSGAPIVAELTKRLGVPVVVDTDVNVEGLGEHALGAARGLDTFLYVTIGTGIGGGGMVNGRLMHGLTHPEMGHIRLPHQGKDAFPGICPFHGDCFEGLASGPAMAARWGLSAKELAPDHAAWDLETDYVAHAMATYILVLSPERIVIGGGVALTDPAVRFFERVREKTQGLLNAYVQSDTLLRQIDGFIVPPGCKQPGLLGGLALAQRSMQG